MHQAQIPSKCEKTMASRNAFKIPRFRLRFLDFRWDFKISRKTSKFHVRFQVAKPI